MSAVITRKPAKAKAPAAVAAPMTLAQATDVAMTELSKAIDLMASAQRAAEDGHHLDRALRVAEEIALDVMGWMDHGQRGPGEWMDRMFDCQAVLRCAALDPREPASTLAASQAAEAVDRATMHFAGLGRSVVATLHDYTGHAALAALDDLAFEAGELMHMAISKCDRRGSAHAAGKLDQAIALAAILVDHERSGEWDSLGAALYLLRVAQQQFNETREGWE